LKKRAGNTKGISEHWGKKALPDSKASWGFTATKGSRTKWIPVLPKKKGRL